MSAVACQRSIRALAIRNQWPAEAAFAQQRDRGNRVQRRLSQTARAAAHGNHLAGIGLLLINTLGIATSRMIVESP